MDKKFGGDDFGSTLAELKAMAPLAVTMEGVKFEGNARKVSAILQLASVGGELVEEIERLQKCVDDLNAYMNEGCICGRAPAPVHPVDARLRKAGFVVKLPAFDDYPASMAREMRAALQQAVEAAGGKVAP